MLKEAMQYNIANKTTIKSNTEVKDQRKKIPYIKEV